MKTSPPPKIRWNHQAMVQKRCSKPPEGVVRRLTLLETVIQGRKRGVARVGVGVVGQNHQREMVFYEIVYAPTSNLVMIVIPYGCFIRMVCVIGFSSLCSNL